MQLVTRQFGDVSMEPADLIHFPHGIIGFESCRHWVLLADTDTGRVAWLQSADRPDVALPVVSPRRYAPDYRVRVSREQLEDLQLGSQDRLFILGVVARHGLQLTLNLRAPVLVNLDRGTGCQVITRDEQPLRLELPARPVPLRKTA